MIFDSDPHGYFKTLNETNAGIAWSNMSWLERSDVLIKVGLDNIDPDTKRWNYNPDDWEKIIAELIYNPSDES